MSIKQEALRVFHEVITEEHGNKSAAAIRLGVNVVTFWGWVTEPDKRRTTDAIWDALDAAGAHIVRTQIPKGASVDVPPGVSDTFGTNISAKTRNSQAKDKEIESLKAELAETKAKLDAAVAELESERGRREFAEKMATEMLGTIKSRMPE